MKSLEFYKERIEDSIKDGLSYKKGEKEWTELLRGLGEKNKYEKMVAFFEMVKEVAPETLADKILYFLQKNNHVDELPFSPDDFDFKGKIDRGGEHKIYLLESKKINYLPMY